MYPFNLSDLNACSSIAKHQVEASDRIPWQDLRFLFGDVIYGGHITDPFDRNLLGTYLESFVCDELLSGFDILPGMSAPSSWDDRIDDLVGYVSTCRAALAICFACYLLFMITLFIILHQH
jgi:hypothetical protein